MGITESFNMLFLMVFGKFPEKFCLGIFYSPSKPNNICLLAKYAKTGRHMRLMTAL